MLTGWHIYPLQLDDLSNISYSSNPVSQPGAASFKFESEGSELLRTLARFAIVPGRAAAGQLRAPSAAESGPIFYRWAAQKANVRANVREQQSGMCAMLQGKQP